MRSVPYLAVVALVASVECRSLFSPYGDFSSELPSDSSEYSFDSSFEDDLALARFKARDSLFRPAAQRMPRVGVRRMVTVSIEPSPADQFASDEDLNLFSPPSRSLSPVAKESIKTYDPEDAMFPSYPKVSEERFESSESDEELESPKMVKPKKFSEESSLFARPLSSRPLVKVPLRPSKRFDWPVDEMEAPRKPGLMRPAFHVSTPSPFERSPLDFAEVFKKYLAQKFKEVKEQQEMDRELDGLIYKYHPNVVQI